MRLSWTLVVSLSALQAALGATPAGRSYDSHNYYVIEHDPRVDSGASLADVARALGVEVVEQAGELRDHWVVRSEKPLTDLVARGEEPRDAVIDAFERLRGRASSELWTRSEDDVEARAVVSSVKFLERQVLRQRAKRAPPAIRPPASVKSVAERFGIKDPLFPDQWHLVNPEYPEHMMNVVPVWDMGFTGKGMISAVVDDGIDFTSDDLSANFDAINSYDFNDHEALPYPKQSHDRHGTRCAGQIAAAKNDQCGVGIAHDSKVAGIRILSKPISDVDEAMALNYGFQNVSVYSCSWGPPDNGRAMGSPSYLIKKSVVNGINNGRGGKGSIFVFASGNGAHHEDQCNYDGYTNSIYSVTVSALNHKGEHPYYSEACAANMIVGYSSGDHHYIVTTDKGKNECATTHGGTSAAAPNVAAVLLLAVQARPELTWRDIQYLCIETAKMINPDDPDWETIATGRRYSYKYGFGVLDAYKFVTAAQKWSLVKPQAWFDSETIQLEGGIMAQAKKYSGGTHIGPNGVTSKLTVTKEMLTGSNFETLEHVNIQVWIDHSRRGDVEVELVSPRGIKSVLGKKRSGDEAKTGFPGWVFMSIKHWGEDPIGEWTIKVSDQNSPDEEGRFLGWKMKFWGTTIDPSKAEKYEVPLVDNVLPPVEDPYRPIVVAPGVTKTHSKPTAYLPENSPHTTPTPTSKATAAPAPTTPTQNTDADEDSTWFTDASDVVKTHKTIFGGFGAISLFGLIAGIYFWRQRAERLKVNYSTLPVGDDHQMATLGGGTYDPEHEGLGPSSDGRHPSERVAVGLGFHSSFLDDDDLSTAGTGPAPKYRDEPDNDNTPVPVSSKPPPEARAPSPTVSGDGSWEHARAP
ncbi:Dibasic-processing endoprotease [Hypsizygus marmoreus]|uniref:Dibasic-processing endoprotease n=1 Tax=Hypsizygus marmoreus TaxID=39966 RepID=A0A369JRH9_HYPMA|nr:Dibasic-processing endoprotease [Hypsizygus marmoreus]